jgi:hypothetical protein
VYDCAEILQFLPLIKAVEQLDKGVASMGHGTLLVYQENDRAWEGSRDDNICKRLEEEEFLDSQGPRSIRGS